VFDWSNAGASSIEWAAFGGDCKYEQHPVKLDHQLILEYDLDILECVGGVQRNISVSGLTQPPLYEGVQKMLEQPGFMKKGRLATCYP